MSDVLRMRCSMRFASGSVLRQYDEVEVFNSRLCAGRFEDAAIDAAFAALKREQSRTPADDRARRPVIVIHCGRLYVVPAGHLTTEPRPAPTVPIAVERPAPQQKALF